MMLTITEVAALLTERGMMDKAGGPVKPDTVKHWRRAGRFPGARRVEHGHGAGRYWLIPQEDVEAFASEHATPASQSSPPARAAR